MRTIRTYGRRAPIAVGISLVAMALAVVACGGSSKSSGNAASATLTTIPQAVLDTGIPTGTVTACGTVDMFSSGFTSTDGQDYWVLVKLGKGGCPKPGELGVQATVGTSGQPIDMGTLLVVGSVGGGKVGSAYTVPKAQVQATLEATSPYSLVVVFTAQKIEKVTLEGNGTPAALTRSPSS
jgi:hypothetical protein